MSAQDLEQRARETPMLERIERMLAGLMREQDKSPSPFKEGQIHALEKIRAIGAALRQQPAPVDLEQFREAVDFMLMHGAREQCIRAGDMLQAIIDNAGEVECPHDAWEENGGARICADCHKYLGGAPHQPAPVVDDAQELPPLPDATLITTLGRIAYTATQMQKYARAALARAQGVQS